jgi:formylglycine-generating enzyme required for sulfatase activity
MRFMTLIFTACFFAMQASAWAQAPVAGGDQRKAGDIRDDNGMKLKLIYCPPGTFLMGTYAHEKDRRNDEDAVPLEGGGEPVEVTLTKGFWLGQTEITQSQWFDVMMTKPWLKADGSKQKYVMEGDQIAASYIDYDVGVEFCAKFTKRERDAGRLKPNESYTFPTEAQWEYACRAGTKTRFSFGDDEKLMRDYAWFGGIMSSRGSSVNDEEYAHPVAQKKPNPWGFYDMHGNCWEHCLDGYENSLKGGRDPLVPQGKTVTHRGGGWGDSPQYLRSAERGYGSRDSSGFHICLRICRLDK